MLAEALLDAEVRIGELLKNIPTAQGTRSDFTSVHRWTKVGNASNHTCENLSLPQKTKSQIVKKFNFTIAEIILLLLLLYFSSQNYFRG
jgi:nitric oxide reductase large subunit